MLGLKLNHVSKRGPCLQRHCVVSVDDWWPKGHQLSYQLHVMIYILYKLSLKTQIIVSHCYFDMWKILQWSSIKNCFLMKDCFHQVYIFKSCVFGLFVVQLSRTDYQDKDNGQHTGSVIPRFGHSSWGTLSLSFISLIACVKIKKQIWFTSIII